MLSKIANNQTKARKILFAIPHIVWIKYSIVKDLFFELVYLVISYYLGKNALRVNQSLIIITPDENGYNPGYVMLYTVEIKKGK